jgi:Family of unknown function (DUF6152)
MNSKLLILLSLTVLVFMSSSAILAHHGTNISYDEKKSITLKGTVTEFRWANPHAQIYFDAKDEKGNVAHWAGELNSPGVLSKAGWTRRIFKVGDDITITLHPSKVAGVTVGVVDRSHPILLNGKEILGTGGNNVD